MVDIPSVTPDEMWELLHRFSEDILDKKQLAQREQRKAFDLATNRRCSIGRLVEDLIAACKE